MPTSGQTRTKFCEICERETIQRLDHMQKAGSGKVIAEVWTCVEGDHMYGEPPGRVPPELKQMWEAS